jgi:hypothetical protein
MVGIYEVRRRDGLSCHDIYIKFHKDWFSHSKVDEWGYTDTQHGDRISLLLFYQSKKSKQKMYEREYH